MTKKLKLAILDGDNRARIVKKYPISDSGKQIKVIKGGEGHFMPAFDNESYIELPKRFLFLNMGYERLYIAKKGAKKCVNFKTGYVSTPDIEQLKESVGATLLNKIGEKKEAFPAWIIYLILLMNFGIALKVFGVFA